MIENHQIKDWIIYNKVFIEETDFVISIGDCKEEICKIMTEYMKNKCEVLVFKDDTDLYENCLKYNYNGKKIILLTEKIENDLNEAIKLLTINNNEIYSIIKDRDKYKLINIAEPYAQGPNENHDGDKVIMPFNQCTNKDIV